MAIKIFLKCWLFYWAVILIAPFRAVVDSPWVGVAIQAIFVLAVFIGYFSFPSNKYNTSKLPQVLPKDHKIYLNLFWLSIILSLAGSLSLSFDRIVVQGISFSDGLAVAREKWRQAGEARGGSISSVYSVMGYFCAPAFYYAIINLVVYKSVHRSIKTKWLIVIILIVWNSVLTGGRSVAFVALIMFVSAQAYHRQFFISPEKRLWVDFFKGKGFVLSKKSILTGIVVCILLGYSLYIFKARSAANGLTVNEYVDQALAALGLEIYPFVKEIRSNMPFSDLIHLVTLFLGYLLHSYVVTTKIFYYPYENDALIIFAGIGLILSKIGIIDPPNTDWFLAGSFSSLPGSLYMQGGFILMVVVAFFIGWLTRMTALYIHKYRYNSMLLFLYIILLSTLIASPVLFIFDSLMFPFILIQFFIFSILLKYRFRFTMNRNQFA